jgi:ACS family hexuronate transporter-like MFS transporter
MSATCRSTTRAGRSRRSHEPGKPLEALLIAITAAAHQGWSANVFALALDMFPKRVMASVTGLGGMAGALFGTGIFWFVGKVVRITGQYGPVFLAASMTYVIALLIAHMLAPKLEPAQIDVPAATSINAE